MVTKISPKCLNSAGQSRTGVSTEHPPEGVLVPDLIYTLQAVGQFTAKLRRPVAVLAHGISRVNVATEEILMTRDVCRGY